MADKRVTRSKKALKNALLELMKQKAFSAISVTEIVSKADYNRGTFYMHYNNKEELLADLIDEVIAGLVEAYRAPYRNVELFHLDELTANGVAIFGHIYEHASLYTLFLHPEVSPDFRTKATNALTRIALEDFDFPQPESGPPIDRELIIVYAVHALLGLVFHWIESGFAHPPEYMGEQLASIVGRKSVGAIRIRNSPAR